MYVALSKHTTHWPPTPAILTDFQMGFVGVPAQHLKLRTLNHHPARTLPHSYQIQLRVAKARELLRKRVPIAQVAQEVGFYDQSHLTQHFKRALGVTPLKYVRG